MRFTRCPGCGGWKHRTSTRCLACHLRRVRQIRSYPTPKPRTDACPSCGGQKTIRARVCQTCHRHRINRPAQGAAVRGDPMRSIDAGRPGDWRPEHLPPACPTCRGFGHVQVATGGAIRRAWGRNAGTRDQRPDARGHWHPCPDCIEHPGSTMTHAAWTARRLEEAAT